MRDRPASSDEGYSAFISYSHHDRRAAARLGARLERYRLPRPIARRLGHRRLAPVFRDREELSASFDLDAAVRDALTRARHLIVVCTRHTPGSHWVGREIALFRSLHGDERIVTATFESGDCFHAQLLHAGGGRAVTPLAADFTPTGDGDRLALLKLVAALAGVRLDELVQRDAQRQVRRLALALAAALALIAAIGAAALLTWRARQAAAAERARAADSVQFQLTRLRAAVKARGSLALADAVNQGVERYYRRGDPASEGLEGRLQWAELLQARAEDDEKRGDLAAAARHATAAFQTTGQLMRASGGDARVVFRHAQSAYWTGLVAWRGGDVATARRGFDLYAALADRLVGLDSGKVEWRLEQGYANSNLGMLALREAQDWPLARRRFAAAQRALAAAADRRPGDTDIQDELADGEAWLADVERLAGDASAGRAHRLAQRRLLETLLRADPDNAVYRADLVGARLGLARITAETRPQDAIAELEGALATATELQRADPENASVARQRRAVELFLAATALKLPAAQRPAPARLDALLRCDDDWRVAGGEELAALCSLVAARREVAEGHPAAARARLAAPRVARALGATALSPRWRINFAAERAALERAMGPAT